MRPKRMKEFRQDGVCLALTSGLTCMQVADKLGIGMSTSHKWIAAHRDLDVVSNEDSSLTDENGWLQHATSKKATQFFAGRKQ